MNFIEPIYRFEMKQRQQRLKRLSTLGTVDSEQLFLKRILTKRYLIRHFKVKVK